MDNTVNSLRESADYILRAGNMMQKLRLDGYNQTATIIKESIANEIDKMNTAIKTMESRLDGSIGSGNWGHAGRPGEVGGSQEGGGVPFRLSTPQGGFTSLNNAYKENEKRNKESGSSKPSVAIANVHKAKPIKEQEARRGTNPNYFTIRKNPPKDWSAKKVSKYIDGFSENCQTCVAAYELRLRGYDVEALPNLGEKEFKELAFDTNHAWVVSGTDKHPDYVDKGSKPVNTVIRAYKWINDTLEEGQRYTVEFAWKGHSNSGHIIHCLKRGNDIEFFDPQCNEVAAKGEKEVKAYLKHCRIDNDLQLLRVDNVEPNVKLLDKVLTKGGYKLE